MELRRGHLSVADAAMLSEYVLAKEKLRAIRQPSGMLERVFARWYVLLLALLVCGTLVVLVSEEC